MIAVAYTCKLPHFFICSGIPFLLAIAAHMLCVMLARSASFLAIYFK